MLGILESWKGKDLREVRGFYRSCSEAGIREMSEPERVRDFRGKYSCLQCLESWIPVLSPITKATVTILSDRIRWVSGQ